MLPDLTLDIRESQEKAFGIVSDLLLVIQEVDEVNCLQEDCAALWNAFQAETSASGRKKFLSLVGVGKKSVPILTFRVLRGLLHI
jgi:hypothetical protein